MKVAGDEEIEPSVAVVVAKSRAGRPSAECHAGFLRYVGEGAIVIVVVETVLSVVRNVEIGPTIVVVVRYDHAETPPVIGYSGFGGDVGKCSIVVVMEKRGMGRSRLAVEGIVSRAIDQVNVEPAIVVVIQKRNARALGF